MYFTNSSRAEFAPITNQAGAMDLDIESETSNRGKKLSKDRFDIKLKLNIWAVWTLIVVIIAIVCVTKFDKQCDKSLCECFGHIITWLFVYAAMLSAFVVSMCGDYMLTYTLFAKRKAIK